MDYKTELRAYIADLMPVMTKAERNRINKSRESFMDSWHNKYMKGGVFFINSVETRLAYDEKSEQVYSALNLIWDEDHNER